MIFLLFCFGAPSCLEYLLKSGQAKEVELLSLRGEGAVGMLLIGVFSC